MKINKENQQRKSTKKINKENQQRKSTKKYVEKFNFVTNIIILLILIFGGIGYSVGFHFPYEILPGQFANGDYSFNGSLNITKNLTVNTNTLFVDSVNNRTGIGTSSPEATVDIVHSNSSTNYITKIGNRLFISIPPTTALNTYLLPAGAKSFSLNITIPDFVKSGEYTLFKVTALTSRGTLDNTQTSLSEGKYFIAYNGVNSAVQLNNSFGAYALTFGTMTRSGYSSTIPFTHPAGDLQIESIELEIILSKANTNPLTSYSYNWPGY